MLNRNQSVSAIVPVAVISLSLLTSPHPSEPAPLDDVLGFLASSSAEERSANKTETSARDSRKKAFSILVVDDQAGFRKALMNSLLALSDVEVSTEEAETGVRAVAILKDAVNSFDVIFLDLILPEMSGLETRVEIKKLNLTSRIVMMTSALDSDEAKKARQLGIKVYDKTQIFLELIDILLGNSGDDTDE